MLFFVVIPSLVAELDKFVRRDVPGIVQNASQDIRDAYTKYETFKTERLSNFINTPTSPALNPDDKEAESEPPFVAGTLLKRARPERRFPQCRAFNREHRSRIDGTGTDGPSPCRLPPSKASSYGFFIWFWCPVMVFFILKDKERLMAWFAQFLPQERGLTSKVWHEVNLQTSNYVRGKFWEVMIVWGVTFLTFSLFGLRATLLISLFVGLSVLVPYVGATVMYLPIAIIGFYQFGASSTFVWLIIAYSIIQILDGNLLAPILMSEATSLHPIAVIVAILIFGGLWGFWGVFFAIPLATLINSIIKAWPMEPAPPSSS